MAGPFTFSFYKPEPQFGVPQNGSVFMPMNGDWMNTSVVPNVRYGVSYTISDTDPFDLGSTAPVLNEIKTFWKYGTKVQGYNKVNRTLKCSMYVYGDTPSLMKYGVAQLQSVIHRATQYTASSRNNEGLGPTTGQNMYIKYQPDSTISPVYFKLYSGYVDTSLANEQIGLLQNMMKVTVYLLVSYAAFSDAVWLQNLVPNGTFAYGFSGYTTTGSSFQTGTLPTVPGGGMWNIYTFALNPGNPIIFNTTGPLSSGIDNAWAVKQLSRDADVWSEAVYNAGNQAGTDVLFTPETGFAASNVSQSVALWLAFEYSDSAAAGSFCSASLQFWAAGAGTPGWYDYNMPAIVPTNNTAITRYAWSAASAPGGFGGDFVDRLGANKGPWSSVTKFRVAFSMDRNRSFATNAVIRKIALWCFPINLPASMRVLPTEYVSQPLKLSQECVITSIQGTVETPVRVKISNPRQLVPSAGTAVTFQQAYIGARKAVGYPYKFYYSYATIQSAVLGIGVNVGGFINVETDNIPNWSIQSYNVPPEDSLPRQYRVIARLSTDQPCGIGVSVRTDGTTSYGDYTIVPNATLAELPNTSAVVKSIDCGIVTLPPHQGSNTNDFSGLGSGIGPIRKPNLWFMRTVSSPAGSAVNIVMKGIWFIPVDQFNVVDTRANVSGSPTWLTPTWHNYVNGAAGTNYPAAVSTKELTIDSLHHGAPSIFMSGDAEWDGTAFNINPAATANLFTFIPSTPDSPEPMVFMAVIRRAGASGNPDPDVVEADPVSFSFMYMPAWEI